MLLLKCKFFFGVNIFIFFINFLFFSIQNTVFKSLTDAVRESEIKQADPSHVIKESRTS